MTRQEQKHFVVELLGEMSKDIAAKIDSGQVPEGWDGIELRQLIADKAAQNTSNVIRRRSWRRHDYENTVLTNNL